MISKKNKALVSAALAAAVTASSMVPCFASAKGPRTKAEAFGFPNMPKSTFFQKQRKIQ